MLSFNNNQLDDEAKYDGLYACSYNLENNVKDIIKIARDRWKIEESFRIMKTELEARPVYLQREDRIKAHFLICYTALLIVRILEKKLKNKYMTSKIINTLRNHNLLKLDEGYIPSFTRNDITDELHDIFKFRTDYEIITPAKMRSIIALTKK